MSIRITYKQSYDLDKDQFFLSSPNSLNPGFKFLSQKDDKFLFFRFHMKVFFDNLRSKYGDDIIIRQVHMISQKTPRHIQIIDFNQLNNLYLFKIGTKEILCILSDIIKQQQEEEEKSRQVKIIF